MNANQDMPVVATWPGDHDEPAGLRVFTGDEFANWHETNRLTDAFANPTGFYGVTTDGELAPLRHSCVVGDWDDQDYATVTHTWTRIGRVGPYTIGCARRDGRA